MQDFSRQFFFISSIPTGATMKHTPMSLQPNGTTASLPTKLTFNSSSFSSMSFLSVNSSSPFLFIFVTKPFPSTHEEKLALAPFPLNLKPDRSVRFSLSFHSPSPPTNSDTFSSGAPAPPNTIHLDPTTFPFVCVIKMVTTDLESRPPNLFIVSLTSLLPLLSTVSLWMCSALSTPGLTPAAPKMCMAALFIYSEIRGILRFCFLNNLQKPHSSSDFCNYP